jgi:hypothetical protein
MASWGEETAGGESRCYACGEPLDRPLVNAGSLRCLDCRATNAPLDPQLAPSRGSDAHDERVLHVFGQLRPHALRL